MWQTLHEITGRTFSIPRSRFLEYTDPALTTRLETLSEEARAALAIWPMVVMTEGETDEEAYVVLADSVELRGAEVMVRLKEGSFGPIHNEQLWKLRRQLDIADWEFSRSHWAVKEVDLHQALTDAGISVPEDLQPREQHVRLTPTRSELISFRDQTAELSHGEIDDLLLVAGVSELEAGRAVGSRADRANAILKFALEKPGAVTAEGKLFSAFWEEQLTTKAGDSEPTFETDPERTRDPKRVFVVHGRNSEVKNSVAAYLREVQLEPVILHEQPNMGRHLLTKFIEEADLATFAVILMTDDDFGGHGSGPPLRPRARQNVILELGYFLARLGQSNVCALVSPGLETPSDFDGVVYVPIDEGGTWKAILFRELTAAGLPAKR